MDVAGIAVDLPESPADPPGERAPPSSSAAITTRAPTMCSPPANRNSADTSARRQHSLGRPSPLNSSFTAAVITTLGVLSTTLQHRSPPLTPTTPTRPIDAVATTVGPRTAHRW